MAGVVEETDDLLAAIDYLVIAQLAGISQCHRASLRIFMDVLYSDQKILNFRRLLTDSLRKDNLQPVRIGSLRSSYGSHVGSIGTTRGDHLIAGKNQRVAQHLYQLLMRERKIARSDDSHPARSGLLDEKELLG